MFVVFLDEIQREPFARPQIGGSKFGRYYLFCDRKLNHILLFRNYFFDKLTFRVVKFCKQFRMRRDIFLCIEDVVSFYDPWFV